MILNGRDEVSKKRSRTEGINCRSTHPLLPTKKQAIALATALDEAERANVCGCLRASKRKWKWISKDTKLIRIYYNILFLFISSPFLPCIIPFSLYHTIFMFIWFLLKCILVLIVSYCVHFPFYFLFFPFNGHHCTPLPQPCPITAFAFFAHYW